MMDLENTCANLRQSFRIPFDAYPRSLKECDGTYVFMIKTASGKKIVASGQGTVYDAFVGEEIEFLQPRFKICERSHENCETLRRFFPYTTPSPVLKHKRTVGLGDRLGIASPGHIRLLEKFDVKPVLAQQSMRELRLTGRSYSDVLDDVTVAVFQEGYTGGFGADGDHLKTEEEVQYAIRCGFTMVTLDCSEHIYNKASTMSDPEADILYNQYQSYDFNCQYKNRTFELKNGVVISFHGEDIKIIVLTFMKAVEFAKQIYHDCIRTNPFKIDFEVSIDEALTPTSPQAHFFIANEFQKAGVKVATIAPGFCGEFQKGIDYNGDIKAFEEEFKVHAAIADHFGYKVSIHTGSDKFSIFPIIGRESKGVFHVKTAGTNWLEAVRVMAKIDPALYKEMHLFALKVLDEAKKYYKISALLDKIPSVDELQDYELPGLMDITHSRQVMHITYGLILQAIKEDGTYLFKERIYDCLNKQEELYYEGLIKHIGRHLSELGVV